MRNIEYIIQLYRLYTQTKYIHTKIQIFGRCTFFFPLLMLRNDFIFKKLPEVDAEFVTDCNDLSLVCRSLVCKNKNKVDEIAMSATSSLVLKTKTNSQLCTIV